MQARCRANPDWHEKNRKWQAKYKSKTRQKRYEYERIYKPKLRQRIVEKFGGKCALSDYQAPSYMLSCGKSGKLDLHNKYGREHETWSGVYLKNPEEFVLLCRRHHQIVHRIGLDRLGLSWEEFRQRWATNTVKVMPIIANLPILQSVLQPDGSS